MYFPHPLSANDDGLIAVGGDLNPERLIFGYRHGIFPWYNEPPICWFFTWPRAVITQETLYISKSMRRLIRDGRWQVTTNKAFDQVIHGCANVKRPGQDGSWITHDILSSYTTLHQQGHAHSVEIWEDGKLIAGLYGIISGSIFCGESMFTTVSNGSKYGFILFAQYLFSQGCTLIDCQQDTDHMQSLGTILLDKEEFWEELQANMFVENIEIDFAYAPTLPLK